MDDNIALSCICQGRISEALYSLMPENALEYFLGSPVHNVCFKIVI